MSLLPIPTPPTSPFPLTQISTHIAIGCFLENTKSTWLENGFLHLDTLANIPHFHKGTTKHNAVQEMIFSLLIIPHYSSPD